jgi:membrane-bound serine protease (ClpP class)
VRRLFLFGFLFVLIAPSAVAQTDERRLDVIDISGVLDNQAVSFLTESIHEAASRGAEAAVIQLDSRAVVADEADFGRLLELVASPPLPVIVWVGPAPAVAYGGAVDLLMAAPIGMAAPGTEVGYAEPAIVTAPHAAFSAEPEVVSDSVLTVENEIHGVVDSVSPAIRQLVVGLDGVEVPFAGGSRQVSTLINNTPDSQVEVSHIPVTFHKPGYWARFLRLAVTPEAAFLFLMAGLTVAAFEFYAIGPGIAAAVAAISLFLASYGLATLPLRWWAVAMAVLGWALLTASYQRSGVAAVTALGSILTLGGGLWFVDGAPQISMNPVVTAVIVGVIVLFYTVAMPTVARSRFSTRTIGRDHLIGSQGTALVDFEPDGEVEVHGARWKASAHREARIRQGNPVRITEVDGLVLEVEPLPGRH